MFFFLSNAFENFFNTLRGCWVGKSLGKSAIWTWRWRGKEQTASSSMDTSYQGASWECFSYPWGPENEGNVTCDEFALQENRYLGLLILEVWNSWVWKTGTEVVLHKVGNFMSGFALKSLHLDDVSILVVATYGV